MHLWPGAKQIKVKIFGKVEQTKYQGLTLDELIAMARNTVGLQ